MIQTCQSSSSHNQSQVLRNQRGKVAVTNCSGFPRQTGFFPMPNSIHTQNILFHKKTLPSVYYLRDSSLCLQMHPAVTDPAPLQVPAALFVLSSRAAFKMMRLRSIIFKLWSGLVCHKTVDQLCQRNLITCS